MKLRTGQPWMPAPDYGQSLSGLGVNLLVRKIYDALAFQTRVLEATVVYCDPDFAVVRGAGSEWMLHADHTYADNELYGIIKSADARGVGVELRVHGCDPDAAVERAREHGYVVLASAADKPHGLREAYIIDEDGYVWVPDVHAR